MIFSQKRRTMINVSLPAKIYRLFSKSAILQSIANFIIRCFIPAKKKIPEGIIILNKQDVAVSGAIAFGLFERTELEHFRKIIKPGMTVIDIGANIGLYTVIAAKLVGPEGKVFAYEPEDDNYEILKKNIEINKLSNVIPLKTALAEKVGAADLYLDLNNRGHHSFANSGKAEKVIRVETDTLDHSLGKYHISNVNVIKMDIEGAEGLAFQGMSMTIAQSPDLMILTEFYPEIINKVGSIPSSFIMSLINTGFSLFSIDENTHTIQAIKNIEEFINKFSGENEYTNIYAVKHRQPIK
jgi:FkbM family methyltransferase